MTTTSNAPQIDSAATDIDKYVIDVDLDVTSLQCPMPLLKAKLALNTMNPGQILKVTATDPGSEKDFHLFADQSNHEILNFVKDESAYFYWIKRGS